MAQPTSPWWTNIMVAFVAAGLTAYVMKGGSVPSGPGMPSVVRDILLYIPHALLLYGLIADMLTYEGVYSIGTLISILALPVHALFRFIWQGLFDIGEKIAGVSTVPATPPQTAGAEGDVGYTGCDLLPFLQTRFTPQSLVIIATFFSYYTIDLVVNRGWANAAATVVLGVVFYLAQLLLSNPCSIENEPVLPKSVQGLIGLIEGLFIGGLSYTVVQATAPTRLPSSLISPFPRYSPGDLKDGKFDKDGNPWICIQGNCQPDLSSAESRKAFAGMIAETTGSGRAALAENCPAA